MFTTALFSNKTLLKMGVHILSIRYLEDEPFCFTKITKYDNLSFDNKVVEDEDGKKNSNMDGKDVKGRSLEISQLMRSQLITTTLSVGGCSA